ncbi:MAG: hypothetical protein KGL13_02395 [Gammaproteobacteria bacterium]|nr:hypothetical protein [Gammaproteobacteria bacterium]MDE2345295.1 hypothetical protein [Gammaproteobacteria bacterium]
MRNINLMKAGYVLRIPNMADIQAVSVSEANSEVRTQIASWRASRGMHTTNKPAGGAPQPSLQLVAPSSAESAGKNQLPGAGNGKNAAATAAASAATGSGAGSAAAAASTTSHAPITVKSSKLAAVQAQAGMQNKQGAEAKIIPLQPHKPAEVKPLPNKKFAVQQPAASSGGLMDLLSNTYVIIAAIAILLLLLVGIIIKKRRAANNEMPMRPVKIKKAPTADADWEKEEKAGLKDVTGRKGDAAPEATPAGDQGSTASHMTTTNLKLDESDPMTEADFHMAYGLYDQAADVLNKALQQDPNRRDLKLKLLEVYFTAGDRSNFVETARALRQEMGTTPDKDWENVAIMGRQVAPEEPLFVETGAAAAGVSVDIPLESAGTGTAVHTDLDPLAGAFEGVRPVSMPPAPEKPAAEQQMVDFSLPDIEPVPKGKKAAPAVAAAEAAGTEKKAKAAAAPVKKGTEPAVTADFGTDSQVEFDKALKELSDFVNTNVPPQDEGSRSGTGTGTVAQSLSLAADADVPAAQAGTSTGTGEETTGLNEIGTKLDLARAYIDMGDADGARNILQEVLEEGDSLQQQEARKLLQGLT